MIEEINNTVIKIDLQLKRFQAASVNYVLDQLYNKQRNKVLIADEVGLGKTIIAKGVIAKAVQKHKPANRPFHVVYICSNQVLAHQNIKKLNPFGKSDEALNRLIFLAKKPYFQSSGILRLSTLTPSTSFELTKSVGYSDERAIIFNLLNFYADFYNYEKAWKRIMRGNRTIKKENWNERVKRYSGNDKLRDDLPRKFKARLEQLPYNKEALFKTYDYLGNTSYKSFYHMLIALLRKLEKNPRKDAVDFSYEIIRVLRKELTKECVSYLNADLFILDEFQRFKKLLDGEDESEAADIAKAVLHNDDAKVLLLSATPFKPFTTQLDQLQGENHHEEFKKIIQYLGGSKGEELWNGFRKDQEAFFEILRHPQIALGNQTLANERRNNLEQSFKKFLSRNERLGVASDYNNMTTNDPSDKTDVSYDDVKNFIALDRLVHMLEDQKQGKRSYFGSTLEFSKSAPYPLSFLQGYKLKKHLDDNKFTAELKAHLKENKEAWIDHKKINNYEAIGFYKDQPNYPNGKFRILANECFKDNGEFLLWVPPTKPKYKLFGKYKNTADFSKILLFSGWAMAPRAIAALLSYEVERRTIGSVQLEDNQEKEEKRQYFDSPRRPSPRLVYSVKATETNFNYNMWMFNLTYPCQVFFENNVLRSLKHSEQSYAELKKLQEQKIKSLFEEFDISNQFEDKSQNTDKSWYWISAPLLDALNSNNDVSLSNIFSVEDNNEKGKGIKAHIEQLENSLSTLIKQESRLGKIPEDLFSELAEITLSSPANAATLALYNNFENHYQELESAGLFKHAYTSAEAFISLFNKPESISAVRISIEEGKEYWRKVLSYCASGSISDLLEEYLYMLKHCNSMESPDQIPEHLQDVLGVRTSWFDVDMRSRSQLYRAHKMRCHFALNYGDQKINTDSGSNRMVNIRSIFNSPFRPFVLASTSVGQEGLDFHFYCRKIFHWNLPHNAIDLEQREGRINRYKGLVIRQKLAETLTDGDVFKLGDKSLWENMFALAEKKHEQDISGIKPFWYLDEGNATIERFVPYHPLSSDNKKYEQLKTTLALYRLTFGQPRQEELVQALNGLNLNADEITSLRKSLLINLSPLKDY
ncbi:DEAD/DEAH box helicase family protein [Bacteroidota bacterium]